MVLKQHRDWCGWVSVQRADCMGYLAFDMVSYSTGFSCQWNTQSVFLTVGYKTFTLRNVCFHCCMLRLFGIMWSLYKEQGEVSAVIPRVRVNRPYLEEPQNTGGLQSSTITAHGKLKTLFFVFFGLLCQKYVKVTSNYIAHRKVMAFLMVSLVPNDNSKTVDIACIVPCIFRISQHLQRRS